MKTALLCSLFATALTLTTGHPFGADSLLLWDVAAKRVISLDQASPRLSSAEIVFVGEIHDRLNHHLAQLEIIKTIEETGKPLAVGLEMFKRMDQGILDQWISGGMDEGAFQAHFRRNWAATWPLYRDIFLHCRENRLPMVGLNVPREVTRQVAREGFRSLSEEQAGMLPLITSQVDPEYAAFIREAYGYHKGEAAFTHFCEAQLVWDTAMAVYALQYLKNNPDRTLVVLAGSGHAWKKGIPAQTRKQRDDIQQVIILLEEPDRLEKQSTTIEDCDYLMLGL